MPEINVIDPITLTIPVDVPNNVLDGEINYQPLIDQTLEVIAKLIKRPYETIYQHEVNILIDRPAHTLTVQYPRLEEEAQVQLKGGPLDGTTLSCNTLHSKQVVATFSESERGAVHTYRKAGFNPDSGLWVYEFTE